jgi:hypothetical protein
MGSPGWFVDPLGGHEKRYFNGWTWTDRVSDGPLEASDPLGNVTPPSPTVFAGAFPPQAVSDARGFPPRAVSSARGFPPQHVVVAPQQVGNGFAVAGLTLGIIGVVVMSLMWFGFFLGGPCGLLGLIFGLIGLRKATTRAAPYRGIAIAGAVLGSVAMIMAFYGAVAVFSLTNAIHRAISSPTTGVTADASPSLNSVHISSCYRDAASRSPAATGTLVNTSRQTQSFRVTIAFDVGQSTAQGAATTGPLAPGETGNWTVVGIDSSFAPSSCTIVPPPATTPVPPPATSP